MERKLDRKWRKGRKEKKPTSAVLSSPIASTCGQLLLLKKKKMLRMLPAPSEKLQITL